MNFTIMAEKLKQILSILSTIDNEMRFEFNMEKLHIRAVDPANAALIDLEVDNSEFIEWNVENDISIGIDLVKLSKLVGSAGKLSPISITINDKMEISFDGLNFNQAMLDPNTIRQSPRIPELDLPIFTIMDLDILKSVLNGAAINGGELITIITDGNKIIMISENNDGDVVKTDPIEIEKEFPKSESMYSLSYLNMFKSQKLNGEIAMRYNTDMPIIFDYKSGGMTMMYMTAPRISNDK